MMWIKLAFVLLAVHISFCTGLETLVYPPGAFLAWYSAGLSLVVPKEYVGYKDPASSSLALWSSADPYESIVDQETAVLRDSYGSLAANGTLVLISTFCHAEGVTVQDMFAAGPYYFAKQNYSIVDVLEQTGSPSTASDVSGYARFQGTAYPELIAVVALKINEELRLGMSVTAISSTAEIDSLQATALSVMRQLQPFEPLTLRGNWNETLSGKMLNLTSVDPRPVDSQFHANADGSCAVSVQGEEHRQGTWFVAGTCMVESTSTGDHYHRLAYSDASGHLNLATQQWNLQSSSSGAPALAPAGTVTQAANGPSSAGAGSPCSFSAPGAPPPQPCSAVCNTQALQPTLHCTIGSEPDTICTTCGSIFAALPVTDIAQLPPASASNYSVLTCGKNCPVATHAAFLERIQGSKGSNNLDQPEALLSSAGRRLSQIPEECDPLNCAAQKADASAQCGDEVYEDPPPFPPGTQLPLTGYICTTCGTSLLGYGGVVVDHNGPDCGFLNLKCTNPFTLANDLLRLGSEAQ
ncbi:hypothetical protein WJX73_006938 [Symbiochloris irregularis]|uniref:Uncharacterized protein n=1 Tax=Symbiochloris irregularis TaxID=706552 RepID=A0AAW1P382_9CHLO